MVTPNSLCGPVRRAAVRGARAQRGDIMLVTMVFLLVCLLGLVVSMRDGIVTTQMNGNNLARQKNVQVADLALAVMANNIETTLGANGTALTSSAGAMNWYRQGLNLAAPTAAYWNSCSTATASTPTSCGTLALTANGNALPYTVYGLVQEGTIDKSTNGPCAPRLSIYYDVFIHVKESSGATAVDTESIYKACVTA